MTAFVIPNAILVTTRQAKYQFASFLARDTTFDVLYNVWRIARPDNVGLSGEQLLTGPAGAVTAASTPDAVPVDGGTLPKVTKCLCGTPNHPAHYKEVALETVIPGTPETIYNLMFTSGFIKEFLVKDQKLMDLQMSDWTPTVSGSKLLTRSMSYIKPLYSTVGPSKTKCEIIDEVLHADSAQCMTLLTTTRTPDVPSGGVFAVKTLTCVTWASTVSSRVSVTTEVEWSGRSFIRSIIERSCIDGQRTHHVALEKAMRAYIQAHQSEFLPEGVDASAITPAEPSLIANKPSAPSAEKEPSEERAEGTGRGLQWAYDTLEGAYKVGSASAAGAIELLGDAWRSSTLTTVLYFVIVLLVISNIWTLKRVGKSEERGRRAERVRQDEHERWLQGVMTGLLGEAAYSGSNALPFSRGLAQQQQSQSQPQAVSCPPSTGDWQTDLEDLKGTLDAVEDRLHVIREQIAEAEGTAGAASSTPLSELD
ncbi:hypothetical protein FISHEDRAFT_56236 [Fistulina hepatica ATCC 64428]|uniref:VASt domain-containing protein n=1 Tax=Fistulina hepatica ATCC 64428 TaxID=1128425 RepID=A0A0D7AMI7_9AGAR|nr:hypothetical protein FISHEDRAFT_56236 [Fistulina hepatica ATCC 64428]